MSFNKLNRLAYITLFCLCFLQSGCAGAKITPAEIPLQVKKLELTNTKKINLETSVLKEFNPVGHQYLFVVIPFGKVVIENPETSIYNSAATKLALKGYSVQNKNPAYHTLEITLTNLQLTAYDLFFIRRLYCEIGLKINLYDALHNLKYSFETKTHKTGYKAVGFQPQLEHIFTQCLEEAINQALVSI